MSDDHALAKPPRGMIGWLDELDSGIALPDPAPGEVTVKMVVSGGRLVIAAASGHGEDAERLLLALGINPDQVRRMLCG